MNENVRIKVFASGRKQKSYDDNDEKKITQVLREQVLPSAKQSYHSVSVKVKRDKQNQPEYMIAYMMRQDTYTADVVRVNVDNKYNVREIVQNYNDADDYDDEEAIGTAPAYVAGEILDFVVGTPVPEIPTAQQAIDFIFNMASSAGLRVKKLVGDDATVENYKHYLKLGVKGFVSVGHGYKGGIILSDGRLRYTWFRGLTNRPLSPAVIYFNSCQVFNPPLLQEIMRAGTRTFIGGVINLLIGPSEEVCKAFWQTILETKEQIRPALVTAEAAHYPVHGAHGIDGDFGPFRAEKKIGIMAVNNRFVCANNGGGTDIIPNRTWIRLWETFNLFYMTPEKIALQASNFKYVCAEGGGGRELIANRNMIDAWETFTLHKQAGNRISLQVFNGQFVCAEAGGASHLMANRSDMQAWETFEFIPLRRIGLIANNGKYVCAENGGGRELLANRDQLRSWETFVLAELSNDQIALQCHQGTYVCAEDGGDQQIIANRTWIRTWEIFRIEKLSDGKVAFKACNNKYLTASGTNPLIASASTIGANESFQLIEIDGNLELEFHARRQEYAVESV